jgi:ATP-binding cassette subfamily B protein
MDRDPAWLVDDQRRHMLGVVPQAVQLFSGTVRDNVTLGDDSLGDQEVVQACRIAGADTFIQGLPHGYDTALSDTGRGDGVVLSAGQRQLLALARALVGQPQVLLLDEATAVVDAVSDAAFRQALRDRVQPTGTAVLTVAHRLATARDADRIVVMSAGRIIEQGTPARLVSTDSTFAALVAMEEAGWDWERELAE